MTEIGRFALIQRVFRKEKLALLHDRRKITLEQYVEAVNEIRAEEGLPPLPLNPGTSRTSPVMHLVIDQRPRAIDPRT